MEATYQRPVTARLYVHLVGVDGPDGVWEATPADLEKFDLDRTLDIYIRASNALAEVLSRAGLDPDDARLRPVEYLVETAIRYPDLLTHPEHDGWPKVAAIERLLRTVVEEVRVLAPLPWTVHEDDGDFPEEVTDANGDKIGLTNLANLHALVAIVNAAAPLLDEQ